MSNTVVVELPSKHVNSQNRNTKGSVLVWLQHLQVVIMAFWFAACLHGETKDRGKSCMFAIRCTQPQNQCMSWQGLEGFPEETITHNPAV